MHMRVLREVMTIREGRSAPLPPAIWHVLLTAGRALPSFASGTIYFTPSHGDATIKDLEPRGSPTASTPGFASLRERWLVQPRLCELVTGLLEPMDGSGEAVLSLQSVYHQLFEWDPYPALGTSYCFLQTQTEDNINAQSELHIIAAGLAICSAVSIEPVAPGSASREKAGSTHLDFTDDHCSKLEPKLIWKTVYEDLATWALFIVCARLLSPGNGTPSNFLHNTQPFLKKLLHKLDETHIQDWPSFERFLSNYAYPAHLPAFRNSGRTLWSRVMESPDLQQSTSAPSSSSGASSVSSTSSSTSPPSAAEVYSLSILAKSAARYGQGIQHPTVVVAEHA